MGVRSADLAKEITQDVSFAKTAGSLPFHAHHVNPSGATPELRTGAVVITAYALGYYLEQMPLATNKPAAAATLNDLLIWLCVQRSPAFNNLLKAGKGRMVGGTFQPTMSYISQDDADAQADKGIADHDQNVADTQGTCQGIIIYYNDEQQSPFQKLSRALGYVGIYYDYVVAAGTYESSVSKAKGNNCALGDVQANGPAYANSVGTCQINNYTVSPTPSVREDSYGQFVDVFVTVHANQNVSDNLTTDMRYRLNGSLSFGPTPYIQSCTAQSIEEGVGQFKTGEGITLKRSSPTTSLQIQGQVPQRIFLSPIQICCTMQ